MECTLLSRNRIKKHYNGQTILQFRMELQQGWHCMRGAWLMAILIGCDSTRWRWWGRVVGMRTLSLRMPFTQLANYIMGLTCVCEWVIVLCCIKWCCVFFCLYCDISFCFLQSLASFPATDTHSLSTATAFFCDMYQEGSSTTLCKINTDIFWLHMVLLCADSMFKLYINRFIL